jgi:hypothetical protein
MSRNIFNYQELQQQIDIPCSEAEFKLMRDQFYCFVCIRQDGLRTIRSRMTVDHAFSREDEQLLFKLFQRIDRVVDMNATQMREKSRDHFKKKLEFINSITDHDTKQDELKSSQKTNKKKLVSYEWTMGVGDQMGNTESLWPFKQRTGRRIKVGIRVKDHEKVHPEEKWLIESDPGAISIDQNGVVQQDDHTANLPSGEKLPARVIIKGQSFPGETGLRILKLREDSCPFPEWEEAWKALTPLNFREITERIKDIDRRRTAISFLGIERLMTQIESKMIREETLEKLTTWVDTNGQLREHKYADTYSLHRVRWTTLFGDLTDDTNRLFHSIWDKPRNHHFVKCKCASSGKEYILWVDLRQVYVTNHPEVTRKEVENIGHWRIERLVDPIEAIAWTFETRLAKGSIEAIIRQGDCILMRPTINPEVKQNRHLTGEEYRTLLRSES